MNLPRLILGCVCALATFRAAASSWLDSYDVVWDSPSADARGSMPLGNGEVTVNAWVGTNNDLQFYIGRSDSYSEISRLLKVGLIDVNLSPNPFTPGQPFSQHLHLRDGVIEISGGEKTNFVTLKLFTDPDKPVVYVTGESAQPETIAVHVESWRTQPRTNSDVSDWTMLRAPFPLVESADHFRKQDDNIVWYHRNNDTIVPETLEHQGLTSVSNVVNDPLLHRTFGGCVIGEGFEPQVYPPLRFFMTRPAFVNDWRWDLTTEKPTRSFSFRVACPCAQTGTDVGWIKQASDLAHSSSDVPDALKRNLTWWHDYWNRSWINLPGNDQITRGYMLQRYMQACDGRGTLPIKFNGGAFTVGTNGQMDDADFRRWGDCHWWQNIRHMYYPMMESGDFEMTGPFYHLYEAAVPICEARAKLYEGVDGAYFPETMTIFGTYANNDYGWKRKNHPFSDVLCPWWAKTRNQGPELVGIMLDRWDYEQDPAFLTNELLPMATAVLTYFDQRFPRDASGKLLLTPTQSLETYWEDVTNDAPTTAGLQNITTRLCALPEKFTTPEQRALFTKIQTACPEVPTKTFTTNDTTFTVLAPARDYNPKRHNVENPELYPVWPFRLYGVGKPGLQMARDTYAVRINQHLDVGWGPDGNTAAVLGLADEAARILIVKCTNSNPAYRWPATWGPNFDWLPDQNHGGNLLNTAQLMLMQSDGHTILLFPAWPREWDVNFKLHAPYQTTVEATLHDGKLTHLKVTPASREKDVVNELEK